MIYQGAEIGRPSYIGTFVKPLESSGYRVEVFGQSQLVSQGTFYLQSTV
jgi:trans-2,3-dihydro-3-hydroxyanthranilate isomerase